MKPVEFTKSKHGKPVVVCEYRILFIKKTKRFIGTESVIGDSFLWAEYPSMNMVYDNLSFQLDLWWKNRKEMGEEK